MHHVTFRSHIVKTLALLASAVFSFTLIAQSYHVHTSSVIGVDGSWDYLVVDASAGRLYITHNTRVW